MAGETSRPCPVCGGPLAPEGGHYTVGELLDLWAPVRFSPETAEEHRRQAERTRLHACARCGLGIFLPPIIGSPRFYEELQAGSPGPYYADEKWEFGEALADVRATDVIVEVGCGPGRFLEKAAPRVRKAFGVEYNDRALEIARGKGLAVFRTDEDVAGAAGPADAVFAFHVLEHAADPVAFLAHLRARVRPNGRIGLSVPNMDGPVRFVEPCPSNMPPHHATRWKRKSLRRLAERLGLGIEKIACEPLTAPFHYYYSHYWAKKASRGRPALFRVLSAAVRASLDAYVRAVAGIGAKPTALLKGQSIYVLMNRGSG